MSVVGASDDELAKDCLDVLFLFLEVLGCKVTATQTSTRGVLVVPHHRTSSHPSALTRQVPSYPRPRRPACRAVPLAPTAASAPATAITFDGFLAAFESWCAGVP